MTNTIDKKILRVVHMLHPYVKNRILVAENLGIFPRNMYKTNGIIDEVVLDVYESKIDADIDVNQLRLRMFSIANEKLMALLNSEKWHKKSISTKLILEEELKLMEEKFTVDGDFDYVMNEELDDISYHQGNENSHLLEYEEVQQSIVDFLELKDSGFFKDQGRQDTLKTMYEKLPLQTSNVVDLYIFGKLNFQEVAQILDIEIGEVKKIMSFVKENFKNRLI